MILWRDADAAGASWQKEMIHALNNAQVQSIRIVVIEKLPPEMIALVPETKRGKFDVVDLIEAGVAPRTLREAAETVRETVAVAGPEAAAPAESDRDIEAEINRLSALPRVTYERQRLEVMLRTGLRASVLDSLVKAQRGRGAPTGQGRPITVPIIEQWPQQVEGAKMLDQLVTTLRRYVILSHSQADSVGLWIAFTHVHDVFDVSPRLVVKSAQKRSGKTTLFSALNRVVARPRVASSITASALLRLIEMQSPTMLIDEMDALMAGDREMSQALRGLMNAGFNRALATVTMNVKTADGGYEPREFSCWTPLALAGIGDVPETVRDRSIEIEMKRKLTTEPVRRLRRRDGADLDEIARKLARWSQDNSDILRTIEPKVPEGLNDRAADAWEPLIALADLVGSDWPNRARAAALALSGEELAVAKDADIDTTLLADIRDAFTSKQVDKLSGESLATFLTDLEGRPWADWKHGKPLTKFQLARRLKTYSIVSGALDLGGDEGRLKGYRREDFEDTFARYLPSQAIPTRELVIRPGTPRETEDSELVISNSDHDLNNAENPNNSVDLHEFTSSNRSPATASVFRGKSAVADEQDAQMQVRLRPTRIASLSGPGGWRCERARRYPDGPRRRCQANYRRLLTGSRSGPRAAEQMFNMLRRHKPEILELLQAERRAVLRHITDHFQSSPLGWCAYCGSGERSGDPFVALFVDWSAQTFTPRAIRNGSHSRSPRRALHWVSTGQAKKAAA